MLHPSYSDLMKVVNSEVEPGEAPVVNSRYSIVMATSKRARQLISGEDALIKAQRIKPLSTAIEELNQGKIKILTEEEARRAREAAAEPIIDLGEEPEEETAEVLETEENVETDKMTELKETAEIEQIAEIEQTAEIEEAAETEENGEALEVAEAKEEAKADADA